MVRNRHVASGRIPEVTFAAPAGAPAGVEVLSLAELRSRAREGALSAPQRPAFHHLLTLSSGVLVHTVDFTGYTLEPGSWLWVRPGQVQQWHDLRQAEGTLILFEPDFLDPATAESAALRDPHAPAVRTAAGEELAALHRATEHLEWEFHQAHGRPPDVHVAVLRHLLAALVLRLAHLAGPAGTADQPGDFGPSTFNVNIPTAAVARTLTTSRCSPRCSTASPRSRSSGSSTGSPPMAARWARPAAAGCPAACSS